MIHVKIASDKRALPLGLGEGLREFNNCQARDTFAVCLSEVARMAKSVTAGLSYADLRKACLNAVRSWPGCETIGGIQITRQKTVSFSVRVILYGNAKRRLADRAMSAVEREMRRRFHLIE